MDSTWRRLLVSRFILTPLCLAVVVANRVHPAEEHDFFAGLRLGEGVVVVRALAIEQRGHAPDNADVRVAGQGRMRRLPDEAVGPTGAHYAGAERRFNSGEGYVGRERRVQHPSADLCTGLGQRVDVVGVERQQPGVDLVGQAAESQKLAKRQRRGGKTARYPHACGGKLADHFAEAGVFTANDLDIGHSQVFKRYRQGGGRQRGS